MVGNHGGQESGKARKLHAPEKKVRISAGLERCPACRRGSRAGIRAPRVRADPVKDAECTGFLQWALPRLGMRWAGFRRVRRQVCKRLGRRVAELGLKDLAGYCALLETDPEEWTRLDSLCRISISRFCRDRGVWRSLEHDILPRLAVQARTRGDDRLQIWSAGCASGEEPYSLALLFAFGEGLGDCQAQILATDAEPVLIERARLACYPASSLRDLPETWRTAFKESDNRRCLRPVYRRSVRFLEQDIRRASPQGPFDLILCRNLAFTYFGQPLQESLTERVAEALVPGGFLVLGVHESLPQPGEWLTAERSWLYRRRAQ